MPKILAIDDNNTNLVSLKAIINVAFPGAALYTALNGQKGIELAVINNPDVILLDVFMPGMDGFEVCRLLKLDDRVNDIPVVFLTALKGDKEYRIKALEVGAEGFLSKPIDETELIAQVRAMVKIKAANEQVRDERRRLEELVEEQTRDLVQSQAQLKGIFENLQDTYFQTDLSGKFSLASPSAIRMYGFESIEEIIGLPAECLYANPLDRNILIAELQSTGRIEDYVCQGRRRDGSAFWASMNVQLLKSIDGHILGTEGVVRDISERKKAEDVLKESEQRFRHISSSISDISYSCINHSKGSNTINWLYGATEKITGYTAGELFAMKCWGKLVVDEDFPIFERCVQNALPGKSEVCQLRLKKKDSTIVWVQATAECVNSTDSVDTQILYGALVDITEKKKAEELLRESEYFFKESQRAAFVGSYKFDIVNDFWSSSEVLERIFGIDKNDNHNLQGWLDIIYPEDREMMKQYFENEVLGQRKSFNKEYRIVRKSDGEPRWVLGLGKLNFDAEDNIIEMIGTIQDITERKQAEELLHETDEFNNSLLKTIPFGMDIVDEQGNVLFQSVNMETTFGKKAIGCKCWDLYRDDKSQCDGCPLKAGIEIGKTAIYESSNVLGGRVFSISHTGMMFRGKKAILEIFQDITERKKSEMALQESVQLFQGLFNASPDAIVLIDPFHPTISWPIVDCNEAACLMNGYSQEEMIGQSIDLLNATIGTPEDRISYYDNMSRKGIIHEEIFHRHKDGHMFPIETSSSIISVSGHEMVLGIDRDITERKQAEMALKKSEDRYRQFVSQVSEGVYRFEGDQPMDISLPIEEQVDFIYDHIFIAECNDAFLKIYGIKDQKDMIGRSHLDLHGGRYHPLNRETLRLFVENGYHIENAITEELSSDGQHLVISNNSLGIIENNQLIRIWGTQFDITEKVKADKVQQMLYSISTATLSSGDLPELIEFISIELGKLLDSNNFFIAFYDEKTNMLSTIYEKDEKDKLNTWSADKSATGYVVKNQKSLLLREDEINKLVELGEIEIYGTLSKVWLGVPLFAHNKAVGAIVVQNYDNSEAYTEKDKQMLEFVSHQMSISIERKKAELELNTALLKAQESDRLKSAFLANMSHEIRTPLNSIIGFSELMTDPVFDADQQAEFAKIILNSGNSLLSIISDIMDFSKIEAGQIIVNKFPFVTQTLISELHREYSVVAQGKGIELRIDPMNPKEDIWITSDENRIRQVLVNLVGNAIKFTKEGFVELGFSTTGDRVQFHVSDSGIGIPEKYHGEIFERFRQVESADSRKYGGNGLGLAISKSLVEILGGEIWMESVQRKGSTFYFTIPK
jgi:PAS domain S-box-containing protein